MKKQVNEFNLSLEIINNNLIIEEKVFDDIVYFLYNNKEHENTFEYKCVELLYSFYFFDLNRCIDDTKSYLSLYAKNMNEIIKMEEDEIDYIFAKGLEAMEYLKDYCEIIQFDYDINYVRRAFQHVLISTTPSCLINHSYNSQYNFKEVMIRKYISYYLNKHSSRYNDKIINAYKHSEIYKLIEKGLYDCNINNEYYLFSKITQEASLFLKDLDNTISLEDIHNDKYYIHNNYIKCGCQHYKKRLDDFLFNILEFIISFEIEELKEHKLVLFKYFEIIKSNYKSFQEKYDKLIFQDKLNIVLYNSNTSLEKISNLLVTKSFDTITIEDIEMQLTNLYNLDIQAIKNENINWYNFLIHGQYYFNINSNTNGLEDYCGAVLYWCKCVEDMLYEKIFVKVKDIEIIKDSLNKSEHTLGTLAYICGCGDKNKNHDYTNKIECIKKSIEWNKKIGNEKSFYSFIKDTFDLNKQYRISCAHVSPITYTTAKKCQALIFITANLISILMKL